MIGSSMRCVEVGYLLACCATMAAAAGVATAQAPPHFVPEPRSGIWEAHSAVSGQDRLFVLNLEAIHSRDVQGPPRFRFIGRLRKQPEDAAQMPLWAAGQ
jgi:hypothetical protein